jgi:hypothetical protein
MVLEPILIADRSPNTEVVGSAIDWVLASVTSIGVSIEVFKSRISELVDGVIALVCAEG